MRSSWKGRASRSLRHASKTSCRHCVSGQVSCQRGCSRASPQHLLEPSPQIVQVHSEAAKSAKLRGRRRKEEAATRQQEQRSLNRDTSEETQVKLTESEELGTLRWMRPQTICHHTAQEAEAADRILGFAPTHLCQCPFLARRAHTRACSMVALQLPMGPLVAS